MKINRPGFDDVEEPLKQKIRIDLDTASGPLPLEIEPLPIGFYDRIARKVPAPKPPIYGVLRNKKGKIIRDERGNPVMQRDDDAPEYLEQKQKYNNRQNAAILYQLLKTDQTIEFSTNPDGDEYSTEFLDAIYEELLAAGMNEGQQFRLISAFNRAAGLLDEEEIEETKKN